MQPTFSANTHQTRWAIIALCEIGAPEALKPDVRPKLRPLVELPMKEFYGWQVKDVVVKNTDK